MFVNLQSRLLPSLPEDCPHVHGKSSMPIMTSDLSVVILAVNVYT
jgi:hypothetical protein